MINLVFFGPPGSGKGTQAEYIAKSLGLNHISTGDIFRKNIKDKTHLGVMAEEFIKEGKLVPDDLTINLLSNEIDHISNASGFIFDGFPRTVKQAESFDALLQDKNMPISFVFSLEVSENELVKRLLIRGQTSGRADDQNESIIRNRIKVYHDQTSILVDYYVNTIQNRFVAINGEQDIESISKQILIRVEESNPIS